MLRQFAVAVAVLVIIAVVLAIAPLSVSSAQLPVPPHPPLGPHRDLDTGESTIERASANVEPSSAPISSESMSPLQTTGMAAWSKLTYQSYSSNWDVFVANGDGSNPLRLTSSSKADITPRLNRGATRVVYASSEPGNYEIFTVGVDGRNRVRLTTQSANDYNPAWSPDGSKIVFNSYRDGQSEVYVMNADGSNQVRLTNNAAYDGQPVWSPDGSRIAFLSDRSGSDQIWIMNANGSGATQLTWQSYSEDPAWSPDGTKIAYDADADGDGWQELLVINANGTNAHVIGDAGTAADMWARSWSPDGRSVAFTVISYIYYQGNWYWTSAYSRAIDVLTTSSYSLGGSDVDWFPDWQTTDLVPPVSSMTALPAPSPSPIIVKWSGTDAGPSGILGYDVQVKDGPGPWTMWLTRTAQTSAGYPGVGGHTYSFRVRAIDNSNNVQVWPANPQTSTTVESLPPVSAVNPLPAYQRGDLSVSWGGSDLGGSGVKSYDVQVRDGTAGTWTDWIMNTPSTMAIFTGISGHTYSFHARATDWAQNLGAWSDAPGSVTFYAWQLAGQIRDTRGYRVVDAQVMLSPAALNMVTSTASGYLGYGVLTGEKSLEVAQPGYGMSPPMNLIVNADRKLDQFLKPKDDVIVNGDFETDFSPSSWIAGGLQSPILTTTIKHTGRQAALLGRPFDWTAPVNIKEPGYNVHSFDMASDPFGNLHVVWKTSTGDVVYTTRSKLGTWSTPIILKTWANQEWQGPAIAADALGHVYVGWGSLEYTTREPDGTWSAPAPIAGSSGFGPQFLVDQQNTLHAMWDAGAIFYASKPLGQDWSAPVVVGYGVDARFKLGLDGSLHAVWTIPTSYQWGVAYATKPAGGAWSPPIELSDAATQTQSTPDIAVDGQNLPHVVWIGPGNNNVIYTHETFNGLWSSAVSIASSAQLPPRNPAIAMIGPATIGVAYFDGGGLKLMQSTDGLPWQEPQSIGPAWGGTPQIELDDQGLPQLAWQTETNIVQSGPASVPLTGDSWLTETLSVPSDMHQPTLSFLYRLSGATPGGTWLEVDLGSETTTLSVTLASNTADWAQKWIDLEPWAGQALTLSFKLHQRMNLPGAWTYIDDVSVGSWLTPDPQTVTPQELKPAATSVITITGENFLAVPQVRLNNVTLSDVTWINTTTLTATVPILPCGRYDLIVANPGGQASGLPQALLIIYKVMLPMVRK